jgi:hypothetical protein
MQRYFDTMRRYSQQLGPDGMAMLEEMMQQSAVQR